jgi:hypothetical protein
VKFTQAVAEMFACQRLEAVWFDDPIRCCGSKFLLADDHVDG